MRRLLTLVTVAACAAAVALPVPAQAHSALTSASPKPGDKVAPGVAVIALTFTALSTRGDRQITVRGPDEAPVPTGSAVLVNAKSLCAAVQPLLAGIYAVAYQATSADGDPVSGKFYFEVAARGRVADPSEPCNRAGLPSPHAGGSDATPTSRVDRLGATAAVGLAGMAVLLLAVGWFIAHIRRRHRGDSSPQ